MTDDLRSEDSDHRHQDAPTGEHLTTDPTTDEREEPAQVDVRRNVPLSAAVGVLAGALAVAFGVRAFGDGAVLDWVALAVLGLVAVLHLAAVVDGRAPLLVADRHGVRLRQGSRWQGIAWPEVECLEHLPRRLPFRDGHLLVVGYDDQQLVVPLTLATRLVGADRESLSDVLAELADGRADVVEVVPGLADDEEPAGDAARADGDPAGPADSADSADFTDPADVSDDRGTRTEPGNGDHDPDAEPTGEIVRITPQPAPAAEPATHDSYGSHLDPLADVVTGPPAPGRAPVVPARVEVQRTGFVRGLLKRRAGGPAPTVGANALRADQVDEVEAEELPEAAELRRTADPDDVADPVWRLDPPPPAEDAATVVIDGLALHPAPEPVVGPQLAAARERLRLSVDQLSERTRIRPHVVEAIEVDDFGPCGGDFYARGHLRTLARVLGVEAAPLVATYDERYADAPLDPRRVFEAELATGVGGSIRGTRGGRNWSVLVAAVMAAVLVWSVARLVMDGPVPVGDTPVLNQSGGISQGGQAKVEPVAVTLTAAGGGAQLVVRDAQGDIVFDGPLAFGQTSQLDVVPPVRIWSSDGSVTASVDGAEATALGETGEEVTKTVVAP